MARALSSGPSLIVSRDAELAEIVQWYRVKLEATQPPADLTWEPVRIGPTWQYDETDGWLLPEATLGWDFLAWCGYWLRGKNRKPWTFTMEQARFLLWYYALDTSERDRADFLFHSAMFQRLKGHGKDPLASTIAAGSLHAPIVFDHWDGDRPIGRDEPDAWTQIIAVSQDQTKNTMKLFPSLISPDAIKHYGIQIGKLNVWSDGDRRQIEAITASVLAVEGGRPKQIIRAETQNWTSANGGHDMAGALEGNAAKAEAGSPARILDIFNAFRPGRDSVAERAREAWESTQGDDATAAEYGVLLDSLEAPPNAPLTAEAAPEVVRSIAGDSVWLDTRPKGRIVQSILNPDNSPSESRRKWYNQITGTEDSWVDPRWVDQCTDRHSVLVDGDQIVIFGDGSKSDDATALVACRMVDGYIQTLHVQQPSAGELVDRNAVDAAVIDAFDRYKVVAFYFDPSHAKATDAVEDDRFWWPLVDKWHERYNKRLKHWPIKTGPKRHAIAFDMLLPSTQQLFQPAVSQLAEDLEAGTALHHGGDILRRHMKNARRREGRFGLTIGKEHRSSKRKVDVAVCAIGARMLWRLVRLANKTASPGKGRVILLE
jgi:hypothetical protein